MTEQIKQIAQRIRELREVSGVSAESLAKELGISLEKYHEYESGNADFPVSLLYEIAGKFHVELTAILTGDEPKLKTHALVRKGRGAIVERRKAYKYQSLAYNFLHKRSEVLLVTVEPKPEGSPVEQNSHPGQEFNFVTKGSVAITIGKNEIILNEGDSLYFDSSVPHSMKTLNNQPAEFLAFIIN